MAKRYLLGLYLTIAFSLSLVLISGCGSKTTGAKQDTTPQNAAEKPAPAKSSPVQLIFAANNEQSAYYALSTKVATIVNKSGKASISVASSTGALDNINRLLNGQADLGLGDSLTWADAYQKDTKGNLTSGKNMRVVNLYGIAPSIVLAREDAGIKTIHDLNGQPWSAGDLGGSTAKTFQKIAGILKIQPKYMEGTYDDVLKAFKDRKIVGFIKAVNGFVPDAVVQQALAFGKVKVLGYSESDIKAIKQEIPKLAIVTIPPNSMHEGQEAVQTTSVNVIVVTHAGIPPEAQYEIAKNIYTNQEILNEIKGIKASDLIPLTFKTLQDSGMLLSAGTVRFFKEQKIDVPASLIPPEYKE